MQNKTIDQIAWHRACALRLPDRQRANRVKAVLRQFDIVDAEQVETRDQSHGDERQPFPMIFEHADQCLHRATF